MKKLFLIGFVFYAVSVLTGCYDPPDQYITKEVHYHEDRRGRFVPAKKRCKKHHKDCYYVKASKRDCRDWGIKRRDCKRRVRICTDW